ADGVHDHAGDALLIKREQAAHGEVDVGTRRVYVDIGRADDVIRRVVRHGRQVAAGIEAAERQPAARKGHGCRAVVRRKLQVFEAHGDGSEILQPELAVAQGGDVQRQRQVAVYRIRPDHDDRRERVGKVKNLAKPANIEGGFNRESEVVEVAGIGEIDVE